MLFLKEKIKQGEFLQWSKGGVPAEEQCNISNSNHCHYPCWPELVILACNNKLIVWCAMLHAYFTATLSKGCFNKKHENYKRAQKDRDNVRRLSFFILEEKAWYLPWQRQRGIQWIYECAVLLKWVWLFLFWVEGTRFKMLNLMLLLLLCCVMINLKVRWWFKSW